MDDPARPARLFEELDYQITPIGPVSLRRRWLAALGADVLEVMLGDEHLMSSLFTEGERSLSRLSLAWAPDRPLSVLIGGLGLGYTAAAALEDARVSTVEVAEYLQPVIDWHERGLTYLGPALSSDPRVRFVQADFFKLVSETDAVWDAILLDIDHAPDRLLAEGHGSFYSAEGLRRMAGRLATDGVFGLWSDDRPDPPFVSRLESVFRRVEAVEVQFPNPLTGSASTCTIYRCQLPAD